VFEDRMLRRIFGPNRDEVTGDWRKLHIEELHNLFSSPSIIRLIKSIRISWAGHVARMGGRGMNRGNWWESKKERDQWEDRVVGGWTILGWILGRQDGMVWTGLMWLRMGTSGGFLRSR
jgi:hypothetical protein